jgi:hypothetical protein
MGVMMHRSCSLGLVNITRLNSTVDIRTSTAIAVERSMAECFDINCTDLAVLVKLVFRFIFIVVSLWRLRQIDLIDTELEVRG